MVIDRLHLCKCMKLRYSLEKKRPLPFDRVHKDSKWQKLFSRGHYHDYWFIYLCWSFVETISLFTGRRKRGGWGEIYGSTCALDSSQILAFQLSGGGGAVETKVLNPWKHWHSNLGVLLPPTHCGLCPLLTDYLELFAFSTPWGFISNWKTAIYCK